MSGVMFRKSDDPTVYSLLSLNQDPWGFTNADLIPPPRRFFADQEAHHWPLELRYDFQRLHPVPSPSQLLVEIGPGETWTAASKRSLDRLFAWFLLCEDPQRRLDAQPVVTLAHQASLVRHVLDTPNLSRLLLADEVGLGKTVEAGLIVRSLLSDNPRLRVLYLAPARLVSNVHTEFKRLGLSFGRWVAGDGKTADLDDPRIIASIHRAAHEAHFKNVVETTPWDVLVVDEAHHLSDWKPGGGSKTQKYELVEKLIARMPPTGRVILMTGTPHQGHKSRFDNLLKLLQRTNEPLEALSGRVIYRTKDDISDWDGEPLFPARQVNAPHVVDLGERHRAWLGHIHDFYEPDRDLDGDGRAAGWRCAQALQWATSSIEAGLGYLIRTAIRAGWKLERAGLREALEAIRPYRLGSVDEPIASLFDRIAKEVGRQDDANDVEDIEDGAPNTGDGWKPDARRLGELLREGEVLVRESGDEKWRLLEERVLRPAGNDKVVLFAQPIETVTALARYLERRFGQKPALIIGNQSDEARTAQVASFWKPDGPRFLVSSKAGGEGINLQCAFRLVHVDVPWNPMDLEQRIGRVHRFGSRRTIVIDTVVVKDSREVDAYAIAHRKLEEVAKAMVPPDRFDSLFARVMSLVPPEEMQQILALRALSPLSDTERQRIRDLVTQGFARWNEFNAAYSSQQREIRRLAPGTASWADIARLVEEHLKGSRVEGFSGLRFGRDNGDIVERQTAAVVYRLADQGTYACDDYAGMPVTDASGHRAVQFGLNVPIAAAAIRSLAFPESATGGAHLRATGQVPDCLPQRRPFGVLALARQTLQTLGGNYTEVGLSLHLFTVSDGAVAPVPEDRKAEVVRFLKDCSVRREVDKPGSLERTMAEQETRLINEVRRPDQEARELRRQYAVVPLFTGVVA